MKTEKIKDGYTKIERFEWLTKCAKFADDNGYILFQGSRMNNPTFNSDYPDSYEIPCKPEYIPYSAKTQAELEEKSMRMRVRARNADCSFLLLNIGNVGVVIANNSSEYLTHREALKQIVWSDGSVFGTEEL